MDSLEYVVRSPGNKLPLRIRGLSRQQLSEGAKICAEESILIQDLIKEKEIPAPKRPLLKHPMISEVDSRPSLHFEIATSKPTRNYTFINHCSTYIAAATLKLAPSRLRPLVEMLDRVARPGLIIFYGERALASTVSRIVRKSGRETRTIYAGIDAEKSYPRRPVKRSLDHALQNWEGDLQKIGAIVLVDEGDKGRSAALWDCDNVPPVIDLNFDGDGKAVCHVIDPIKSPATLPKISIVTVSFNQAPYLEACIQSVLNQGYENLEYIIVDGGSTDGSLDIIERYRKSFAHVIVEPDDGQSDALNKGFAHASGEVLNWLCSDDLLAPNSLHHIARAYMNHKPDLIAGKCSRIRETSDDIIYSHYAAIPLGKTVALDPLDILKFIGSWQQGNYFFQPEVFFSRKIWLAAGGYIKRNMYYAMDYDMWLRMALAGATVYAIAPPIAYSRVHELQKTRDDQVYLHQLAIVMEEYADLFDNLLVKVQD